MTKEAVAVLKKYTSGKKNTEKVEISVLQLNRVIRALEQETIAQERYKDLCEYFGGVEDILKSRDVFKAWLFRVKWYIRKAEELYEKYEQKSKTGHWIDTDNYYRRWKCSECGYHTRDERPPFCPNCRAEMVDGEEE